MLIGEFLNQFLGASLEQERSAEVQLQVLSAPTGSVQITRQPPEESYGEIAFYSYTCTPYCTAAALFFLIETGYMQHCKGSDGGGEEGEGEGRDWGRGTEKPLQGSHAGSISDLRMVRS